MTGVSRVATGSASVVGLRHAPAPVSAVRPATPAASPTDQPTDQATDAAALPTPTPAATDTPVPGTPDPTSRAAASTPRPVAAATPPPAGGKVGPTPLQPGSAPHCTGADFQLTVEASRSQDGTVYIGMIFERTSNRTCGFPQGCNVYWSVDDASGNRVDGTAPDDCNPWYADIDPSTTRFTHEAGWAKCHGPGSYTVHAEWTPDWKGTAPYSTSTTEGEGCPSPTAAASPTP